MKPGTQELFSREETLRFFDRCRMEGLLLLGTNPRVRLQPALNCPELDWAEGLARLERACRGFEAEGLSVS